MSQPHSVVGTCHCGAVSISLAHAPTEITHCNCSLCRRYGVLWAYDRIEAVTITTNQPAETYAWNGRNVDFHRCADCGCVTHWLPRKPGRDTMGINARLFDPALLAAANLRYKDSAGSGLFH